MRRLAYKKVFLVLDDVSSSKQIEDLFVNHNINSCLGLGSRVIVTTRDKHTCDESSCEIYEVKELYQKDSLELFCMSSFKEKHPKNGYEELSKCVVGYCKGNPLALKVMGANMSRFKNIEAWKSEVEKLQKIPNGEIMDILKLSLEDLDYTQMNIFLDIACFNFLRRSSFDDATNILDACSFCAPSGIQVLLDKALIAIRDDDTFEMHDLIQEMGQQIVHEESIKDPCMRSRLWKNEAVVHVLKNNKGTEKIEGIEFHFSEVEELSLSSDSFKRMPNLRYIDIFYGNVYFPDGLEWLSDKLRYLSWNEFPLESLPSTFCAELLVELCMPQSKLKKLWDGVQDLANLRRITLDGSIDLIEMPDLSRATNLEELNLYHCENLCELCPSILSLPKLKIIDLEGCTKIQSLRSNIHSKSLQKLHLSGCSSLTNFFVTSEKLNWLNLSGTAITELSSSIWHNTKLTHLDPTSCEQLSIVGKNFIGPLGFLTKLDLCGCKRIDKSNLAVLLDGIRSLKVLKLFGCSNLEALPENIQKHSMLEELELDDCTKLVFSLTDLHLPSLRYLSAANCTYLDTNSIQPLLLDNTLPKWLLVPGGGQILGKFDFHTTDTASITIPPIQKSGLHSFIFYTILPEGLLIDFGLCIRCWIYENGEEIDCPFIFYVDEDMYIGKIISDHVVCFYYDIDETVGGHYNLSFEFELQIADDEEWSTNGIKGCGVLCVYDDTLDHEFEMTDASRRSGVEIVELECSSTSTAQASNHESLVPGVIRNEVEVSTNANEYENEQQQPQLLQLFPPNERKRKMRT